MIRLSATRDLPSCAGVYLLHFPNGKKYVGMTTKSIRARVLDHKNAAAALRLDTPVRHAIAKHGIDNVIVTAEAAADPAQAEMAMIAALKAAGVTLYNMTDGGEGTCGFAHSAATRGAMSRSALLTWTPERRKKASDTANDPAFKADISRKQRATWTPERRAKMSRYSHAEGLGARTAKLSAAHVIEIIKSLAAGASCASLGRRYAVSAESVSHIKLGKNWAHVTGIARPPKGNIATAAS